VRIALGGIGHENNTYADSVTGPTGLDRFIVRRGDRLLRARGTETFLGGFLDGCESVGAEPVPTLRAFAGPSGTATAEAGRGGLRLTLHRGTGGDASNQT
jgi:microcystin degradation protein MlrC